MVGCGRCPLCLAKKSQQWIFRLSQEAKFAKDCSFVTLTYNDANLPGPYDNGIDKIQRFMKRFRKNHKPPKNFKYYLISELGGKFGRLHYHALFFNCGLSTWELHKALDKLWPYGHNRTHFVVPQRIHYVAKYCVQDFCRPKPQIRVIDGVEYKISTPSFYISPHSNGLGLCFLTPQMLEYLRDREDGTYIENGHVKALPTYYLDKVFGKDTPEYKYVKYLRLIQAHNNFVESTIAWENYFDQVGDEEFNDGDLPIEIQEIHEKSRIKLRKMKQKYNFVRPPKYEYIYQNFRPEEAQVGLRFESRGEVDNRFRKVNPDFM